MIGSPDLKVPEFSQQFTGAGCHRACRSFRNDFRLRHIFLISMRLRLAFDVPQEIRPPRGGVLFRPRSEQSTPCDIIAVDFLARSGRPNQIGTEAISTGCGLPVDHTDDCSAPPTALRPYRAFHANGVSPIRKCHIPAQLQGPKSRPAF
jgi:hypothetical protein